LFSGEDYLAMIEQTVIDGVTVARGSTGNPWIYAQARAVAAGLPMPEPPTLSEQASAMQRHFSLCELTYGESRAALIMRKFCIKYAASHPKNDEVRLAFIPLKSRTGFESVLNQHYATGSPGRYVPRKIHCSQEE